MRWNRQDTVMTLSMDTKTFFPVKEHEVLSIRPLPLFSWTRPMEPNPHITTEITQRGVNCLPILFCGYDGKVCVVLSAVFLCFGPVFLLRDEAVLFGWVCDCLKYRGNAYQTACCVDWKTWPSLASIIYSKLREHIMFESRVKKTWQRQIHTFENSFNPPTNLFYEYGRVLCINY